MNHKGVCRNAPATPGLLNMRREFSQQCGHQIRVNTWTGSYLKIKKSVTCSKDIPILKSNDSFKRYGRVKWISLKGGVCYC